MHAKRDCEVVLDIWEQFVKPDEWEKFTSLGLSGWLEWNLTTQNICPSDIRWPTFFGTAVSAFWYDRNSWVFKHSTQTPEDLVTYISTQVSLSTNILPAMIPTYVATSKHELHIARNPPDKQVLKVNIDGSHRRSTGLSACGGVVRDHTGRYICGFHCKLGACVCTWEFTWPRI